MNGPIRAHAERGAQRLLDAIGADGDDDHLGLAGILDAEGLLERVGVVAVDLELDVAFLNPGAVAVDVESRVLVRHLLQAHHDLHGGRASELHCWLVSVAAARGVADLLSRYLRFASALRRGPGTVAHWVHKSGRTLPERGGHFNV